MDHVIPPTPSPTRDVLRELFARLADGGFDASSLLTLVLLATCLTFAVGVLLRHPRRTGGVLAAWLLWFAHALVAERGDGLARVLARWRAARRATRGFVGATLAFLPLANRR